MFQQPWIQTPPLSCLIYIVAFKLIPSKSLNVKLCTSSLLVCTLHTCMYCMYTTCIQSIPSVLCPKLTLETYLCTIMIGIYSKYTNHAGVAQQHCILLVNSLSLSYCSKYPYSLAHVYIGMRVISTVLLCSGIVQLQMLTFASFHLLLLWCLFLVSQPSL